MSQTRWGEAVLRRSPGVRRALLGTLVAALPVTFLWRVTNDPFNVPKLALLFGLTSLAAAVRALEAMCGRGGSPPLRRMAGVGALVLVPVAVSWVFTPLKGWALLGQYTRFEGLLPVLALVVTGALVAEAFAGRSLALAWTFVGSVSVSALYGLAQSVGFDPFEVPVLDYTGSTVGDSNFFGGLASIALPLTAVLGRADPPRRYVAVVCAAVIGVGIVMSFSQGAWVAGAASLVFAIAFLQPARKRAVRRLGVAAIAVGAAILLGAVAYTYVSPFGPLAIDTSRARGLWWRSAVSMAADSPVWGHGPNAFALEGSHYRVAEDALAHGADIADSPHSVYMTALANTGALGLAGYLLLVAWLVRAARRLRDQDVIAKGFCAAIVAYLLQALVSIDVLPLPFSLWVCVGGLIAATSLQSDVLPTGRRRRVVSIALIPVLLSPIAALWFSYRIVAADVHVDEGIRAFVSERVSDGIDHFEAALALHDDYGYRARYGGLLGSTAANAGDQGRPFLEEMKRVMSYQKDYPEVQQMAIQADWLHQWSVYDPSTDEEAERIFRRVIDYDEFNPEFRVSLAEILLHLGRPEEAEELLRPQLEMINRYPDYGRRYPQVWAALAISLAQQDRLEEARTHLATAEEVAADLGLTRRQCHVFVAQRLVEYPDVEMSIRRIEELNPVMLLCTEAVLDLLPGYEPRGTTDA